MKIGKGDIGLLILLAGIIAILVVYNLPYKKNQEAQQAEESKLAELQVLEADLEELQSNMPYYQSEVERMNTENNDIIAHFPANVLPENEIMYARELEKENEVAFSAISYGTPAEIGSDDAGTGIRAYDVTMSLSYMSTYDGLKEVIAYTKKQYNRMVLNSVTASYDTTTGNLSGSINIDQYFMTGTDAIYEAPVVNNIDLGTDNIFGTVELPVNEEETAEDGTAEQETAEEGTENNE